MKRYIRWSSILVALILVLSLITACAKQAPPPAATTAPATAPVAAPVTTPATTPVKPIELKFAYHGLETHPMSIALEEWASNVEKATGGKIKITSYPAETLCKGTDTVTAVKGGITDIGWAYVGFFPGQFPLTEVHFLPCIGQSADCQISTRVLMESYYASPEMQAEYSSVKFLYMHQMDPAMLGSKEPIRTLEDLAGMKIRVAGVPTTEFLKQQGAVPVQMGTGVIYENLQKGVIDGFSYSWDAIEARRLQEQIKYATDAKWSGGAFFVIMNLAKWKSFSPDIQKAIESVSGIDTALSIAKALDDTREPCIKMLKDSNVEVISLSAAEKEKWREAAKPVWDKWVADMAAKGQPGQKVLDSVLALFNKYTK